MNDDTPQQAEVILPEPDDVHFHTGYYHLEYWLADGSVLYLARSGFPSLREHPARLSPPGFLSGHVKGVGRDDDRFQREVLGPELSQVLEWNTLESGKAWWSFAVTQSLTDKIFDRIQRWIGKA